MPIPEKSRWTKTAQIRNAPMERFNSVHANATIIIWLIARHLEALLGPRDGWIGRGWDPKSTEHGTGRALDIMISEKVGRLPTPERHKLGEEAVAWLILNADQLRIRHIIWDKKIWKRRYRGTATEWTNLVNRSGVSDWHQDHIHIYLDDEAGSVPDTPLKAPVVVAKPGLPSTGVNAPTAPDNSKGILDMTNLTRYQYQTAQKTKLKGKYLNARKEGWWVMSAPAGPVAISVHGYASTGPNCSIFIQAERDTIDPKDKQTRTIGRVMLPDGTNSFQGGAVAILQPGEVIRLLLANHSGKEVTISNVTTDILHA